MYRAPVSANRYTLNEPSLANNPFLIHPLFETPGPFPRKCLLRGYWAGARTCATGSPVPSKLLVFKARPGPYQGSHSETLYPSTPLSDLPVTSAPGFVHTDVRRLPERIINSLWVVCLDYLLLPLHVFRAPCTVHGYSVRP